MKDPKSMPKTPLKPGNELDKLLAEEFTAAHDQAKNILPKTWQLRAKVAHLLRGDKKR